MPSEFQLEEGADRRTFPDEKPIGRWNFLGIWSLNLQSPKWKYDHCKVCYRTGQDCFCTAGRVDHPESQGCLDLLRDGATLVRHPNDIIEELSPMLNHSEAQSNTKVTPEKKDLSYLDQEGGKPLCTHSQPVRFWIVMDYKNNQDSAIQDSPSSNHARNQRTHY